MKGSKSKNPFKIILKFEFLIQSSKSQNFSSLLLSDRKRQWQYEQILANAVGLDA